MIYDKAEQGVSLWHFLVGRGWDLLALLEPFMYQ